MKLSLLLTTILIVLISCKTKTMRARSASMEGTIKEGQMFSVFQTKDFKRNDIVVIDYFGEDYFSEPDENGKFKLANQKRLYRITAMSSDNIELESGELYVNGIHNPLPETGKMEYLILSRLPLEELENDNSEWAIPSQRMGDTIKYQVALSKKQIDEYAQKPGILAVRKNIKNTRIDDSTSFARERNFRNWSMDNYGPLKIPSPGDSIIVDDLNFQLYHNIPGVHKGMNVIKEKLYFVLGDNRHHSEDSRFIGLISYSKLYGVVH